MTIIVDDDGIMHKVLTMEEIEEIKAEIANIKGDNFPNSYYIKIIDKHLREVEHDT